MTTKAHEKFVDEVSKMSVIELSELVKELEKAFGVSAAMPMAGAGAAAVATAAPAAEEKTEFKVILEDGGPEKIKTIKALRSVTALGLTEAKAGVENTPFIIGDGIKKDDAKKIKEALEAVGAKVKLA
jgi:large subunit ribosomal protein L7/L12